MDGSESTTVFPRLISVTDPLNRTTRFGYDANGNLTRITNALGRIVKRQVDAEC